MLPVFLNAFNTSIDWNCRTWGSLTSKKEFICCNSQKVHCCWYLIRRQYILRKVLVSNNFVLSHPLIKIRQVIHKPPLGVWGKCGGGGCKREHGAMGQKLIVNGISSDAEDLEENDNSNEELNKTFKEVKYLKSNSSNRWGFRQYTRFGKHNRYKRTWKERTIE